MVERFGGAGSATVVIVNWNGREHLQACLESVLAQVHEGPFEVVLVDNCSTDGSVEYVERSFPTVRILRAEQNNYAAANNLGAASSDSEFIVCLNTDTRVEVDWLRHLVECAQADPGIGAVSSLVLFADGRVNSAGIEPLPDFHWQDRGFETDDPEVFEQGEVYGVSGCAVLYRRACWDQAGGLDEDFQMYYEDVDMSLRCRRAGWKLLLCPASRVHHEYNASIRKREAQEGQQTRGRALKDDLGERNRLFILARHYPEVLFEYLPRSQFFLGQAEETVAKGVGLALKKYLGEGIGENLRAQLRDLLLEVRGAILQREGWARTGQLYLFRSQQKVRDVHCLLSKLYAEHAAEKRSWQARVQRLENQLSRSTNLKCRAESEALNLRSKLVAQRTGQKEHLRRDHREIAELRREYEREVQLREKVIADLRRALNDCELRLQKQHSKEV